MLAGFLVACIFHQRASAQAAGWPYDSFLFRPAWMFADLHEVLLMAGTGDPYYQVAPQASFPFQFLIMASVSSWSFSAVVLAYLGASFGAYLLACVLA
ncbi:MAG TPA: hypothetical protein VK786_07030, partial [bacterium]|nr:hypothetical protein [bacterium]